MKKKAFLLSFIVLVLCAVMALVDGVFMADYFIKSGIKLVLFLGIPLIYAFLDKEVTVKNIFKIDKKGILPAILMGLLVYGVIVGGYFLLRGVFDFTKITGALTKNIGVTGKNFIFVSIYIALVNSLLEEFFFRGFAFLTLSGITGCKSAHIFSAGVFALYHVAMMIGWFDLPLFIIVMAGLFAGGFIFNVLNKKSGTIYPSWFLHMFANFGINTVGFILFGII